MGLPRFTRPKGGNTELSPNLYVANCGPAVGISFELIASVFGKYGEVKGVFAADESGSRVIICFNGENSAESAMKALDGRPCPHLGGRSLHIRYSVQSSRPFKNAYKGGVLAKNLNFRLTILFNSKENVEKIILSILARSIGEVDKRHFKFQANDRIVVSLTDSELGVPGVYLLHDFVSVGEEEDLLAAVDSRSWNHLAKRSVQHYGYEFRYDTRNVNTSQYLGELPSFLSPILERITLFEKHGYAANIVLDQLTVNEYPIGVGLSPHIDTHSAFDEYIFSLSLAGPCIMEFRKYPTGIWLNKSTSNCEEEVPCADSDVGFLRRAIYLPPRSMLLLSGEARYAWHHYIPHHKFDRVNDEMVRRKARRVSFTLRKVRIGACQCEYPEYCDSQK